VAAGALDWGEPVLESAITAVGPLGPYYRGQSAHELAGSAGFESVAELLWTGARPDDATTWERTFVPSKWLAALPAEVSPLRMLAAAVPMMAAHDPAPPEETDELPRARRLVRRLAACLALRAEGARARVALEAASIAETLAIAFDAAPNPDSAIALIDRILVLCADHELNPSTFAARIAASTGADLHACVAAALATLSGPRHGGASERVEAVVQDVDSPRRASGWVRERIRRGQGIPGFGHRLYPEGDPRVAPIVDALGRADAPALRTLQALRRAVEEQAGLSPNLDFALVAGAAAMGLPPGTAGALFAVGRSAGWIAHALEQRAAGYLIRPRARYNGPNLRAPTP